MAGCLSYQLWDDQYEPHLAYSNTLNLINREGVFALIGEGRDADLALGVAIGQRARGAVHCSLYRRRFPAGGRVGERGELAGLVPSGS